MPGTFASDVMLGLTRDPALAAAIGRWLGCDSLRWRERASLAHERGSPALSDSNHAR